MYYDKDRQLHKLFPFTTGIHLVLLYQQKEEKKKLHWSYCTTWFLWMMQRSKSLCLVDVHPLSQQKKKKTHFTTKGKQVRHDSTFLEKAEAQIRVWNHSNLLIKWAVWEFRSLWTHQFKSEAIPLVHTFSTIRMNTHLMEATYTNCS